ncbi:MAG: 1-acyl-sn-glycerol-3-phosphate acyltransferase [Syntrophales bacterium]|nr:1-acyl-sn-glycerol-3-phosphate acyltransferase [Syntrophales bacterium]MDD5233932.1 1-acyl-sn-glycerol-3-phosphate acyltransferase [Syntrophales bacterium]MDD5532082.1 1-acyl-sn-glycerol-3-phosphate acyltransferase [Syntrophales bacterium]
MHRRREMKDSPGAEGPGLFQPDPDGFSRAEMDGRMEPNGGKWAAGMREKYTGFIGEKRSLFYFFLFRRQISRIGLSDEDVSRLEDLFRRGAVVFAQKNKSQIDCLILQEVLFKSLRKRIYCHQINMAFWNPFTANLRVALSRAFDVVFRRNSLDPDRREVLEQAVEKRYPVVIFTRGSDFPGGGAVRDPLIRLMNSCKDRDFPVFIVPVMTSYGKRREKAQKTFAEILFGERENPTPLVRMLIFLRHAKKAAVVCGDPVELGEYLEKNSGKNQESLSYCLRKDLIDRIDAQKRAVYGPVLKSREELIVTTLRDTYLTKYMEDMAAAEKKEYKAVFKEAKKYLKEITADYNEIYIEIWQKALTWLWNNIYDGVVVDREGLLKIKDISKRMPFVIIPCHRSHIDYLLLSYVFDEYGIQLPFVAAGTNLLFWPLGPIFRKSGAFFIRRSFKGHDLYQAVFAKYMKVLLKEGLPIEFFIEGGRSRTGKMAMPKYGILSMIIQAYKEGIGEDLAVVPVFIGYDRVIEEKSYLKEVGGEPKKPENAADILKSSNALRRRFGSVYVNVGEPILLKSYLSALERSFEEMSLEERRSLYRKIGYEIVHEINQVSVVAPVALAACALLCHDRRGITDNELRGILDEMYRYLVYRNVKFASTFSNREKAIDDALALFESTGTITRMGIEEEDMEDDIEEIVYSVEEGKRLNLEYYKNNILHFFVPLSFVATSILSSREDFIPLFKIMEDYNFFKRLFRNDFIFNEKIDDAEEVHSILSYLHEQGMIKGEERENEAWIEVKGKGRTGLRPFAGLIHNYIESYWVVVRGCSYLKKTPKTEREFAKKMHQLGTRMYKKGEIVRGEALSNQNYQSAIKFLTDSEVISLSTVRDKKDKKDIRIYALTDNKTRIENLRQRLFRFL